MRVKTRLLPENNYFCELGFCCVLVKDFIKHYCAGDVSNLLNFSFTKIIEDEKFGDVGKGGGKRKFATVANSKLAKAIFFIILGEKLPNLNVEDLFDKSIYYKGTYLNEFSTLFSEDYSLKTINKIFADEKFSSFRERIKNFYNKTNTIGNFIMLPNLLLKTNGKEDKNTTFSNFNNYFNIFLSELDKVFCNDENKNEQLNSLVKTNDFYFSSDYIDMNIKRFCNTNIVQNYIEDPYFQSFNETNSFKYIDLISDKSLETKIKFIKFANTYMDKIEEIINSRSNYIISILKEKIV